jgi:hypothetical protein
MSKQDHKLMASSKRQKYEPQHVAKVYKIPVEIVRDTAKEIGKNGKSSRSLAKIYAALEAKGHRKGGNAPLPADTEAPTLPQGDVFVTE